MILGLATSFYLDESSSSANISGSQAPYADPQHGVYRDQIKGAVDKLGDPDGLIISSHYFRHMPFSEIASRLGLTPARVSQLHKRGLEKLRLLLS
jgi:RNA polymerase sigma factor FliA